MKIVYFALVSFDDYVPGDIIPGATEWPSIAFYVAEGKVAPVLVATLPQSMQDSLMEWYEVRQAELYPVVEEVESDEDETEAAETFDPGEFNVEDVIAYVEENPDEAEAILALEVEGKNRVTLVHALTPDADDAE
jgi:hypothetical protein